MNESSALSFDGLGIAPAILDVLTRLKFTQPTPIQAKCIPIAVEGKDLIGIAQTGTGKTLAFGIPMIQALLKGQGAGLIVLPTRELALQVETNLKAIGTALGLRTAVLIGGESMERQRSAIRKNPHLIIATPGRLIDHLEHKWVSLKGVSILVLDEADRMLDMGFAPQLKKVLAAVPADRQTMLFSATMPSEIVSIATASMKLPLRVEVAPQGTAAEFITQELFFVPRESKIRLLEKLLSEYRGSVLVFSRTKFGAKKVAHALRDMGHTAAELHANKSLNQRKEALDGFRKGNYRVLVATDIAARGIDVVGIEAVINFDLPDNAEDYVHRIGRTGRAGHKGHAISFATPDQSRDVRDIERLMRIKLPVSQLPNELPAARATRMPARDERRSFGGGGSRRPFRGGRSNSGGSRRPYRRP